MTSTAPATTAVPPIPYVVASWLGFTLEHIVAGLRSGSISPPAGAPPGWLPAGAVSGGIAQDAPSPPASDDFAPDDAGDGASGDSPDPRTAYLSLVRRMDPSLDDATFDAWWRSAGDDDASRASRIAGLVWRTVTGGPAGGSEADDTGALGAAIERNGTRATLVSLASLGSVELARRARADPGVLGALAALDAFAFADVTGGGAAARSRFDPATGEALVSDAWIDDRAKLLAWRQALADDPHAARDVDGAWRFVDRSRPDDGPVVVGDDRGDVAQVVFARDGGDLVDGGATTDRLHGGDGADALRGGDGDDLVEGAHGDDILSGDRGRDRVDGGAGADDLAGGEGGDVLDAGSGDDTLDGGRGDDMLAGGDGHDVYAFSSGDGRDLVVDADGSGEIRLDGERLTGPAGDDGAHVSYLTHDDGAGGTTLIIRTGVRDGDGAGTGEIRIRDWREGMLGIDLSGAPEAAVGAPNDVVSAPLPRLKPRISWSDDMAPGGESVLGSAASAVAPQVRPRVERAAEWRADGEREPGNESGWGPGAPPSNGIASWIDGASGVAAADRAAQGTGGAYRADRESVRPLDIADWSRALRAASSPPDVAPFPSTGAGPDAVCAAEVAGALADHAGAHDGGEAVASGGLAPAWSWIDDWPPGLAPPDAPTRPAR